MGRVEEVARTLTLVAECAPEGPKAEIMTWEEQVEALGKQISRSPSDIPQVSGASSASGHGKLDHWPPPRLVGAPRGPRFTKGSFRSVGMFCSPPSSSHSNAYVFSRAKLLHSEKLTPGRRNDFELR